MSFNKKHELDLLVPPEAGRHIVEAGAGTGKTFSIAIIYLWMLLEKRFNVQNILVVTFTDAATVELRERIYSFIHEALKHFSIHDYVSDNPIIQHICHRYTDESEIRIARLNLERALHNFDDAAVYTIHSFCSRLLKEYSIESRSIFDAEIIKNESDLVSTIARNFWRMRLYTAPLFVHSYFSFKKINEEGFINTYRAVESRHTITVENHIEGEADYISALDSAKKKFKKLTGLLSDTCTLWKREKEDILNSLNSFINWSGNYFRKAIYKKDVSYFKDIFDSIFCSLNQVDIIFQTQWIEFFRFMSRDRIEQKACKKGHEDIVPEHPFFTRCSAIVDAYEELESLLDNTVKIFEHDFIQFTAESLGKHKRKLHLLSYNDLLINLEKALGSELKKKVSSKFPAVLIDEFQDTDPVQFNIFDTFFSSPQSYLYFIGDPKQAIYSFRGADIYTYLSARDGVSSHFTLSTNRRSVPEMVTAVNELFKVTAPFVSGAIEYIEATGVDKEEALVIDDDLEPFVCTYHGSALLNKETAREAAAASVASEISALLSLSVQKKACFKKDSEIRPLSPEDIAVIVRTKHQGELVVSKLKALNINAVDIVPGNLFLTLECSEILMVLEAVANPFKISKVRAALTTRILGYSIDDVVTMSTNDEKNYSALLESFHTYNQFWINNGFYRMFQQLMHDFDTLGSVLSLAGGERTMTNYMQLIEIVHAECAGRNLGPEAGLYWFSAYAYEQQNSVEENPVRIESDENAVKVMTIHKSKGLEFPVVFVPFCWDSAEPSQNRMRTSVVYHDDDGQLHLDLLGKKSDHYYQACDEVLSENLRLLYVALTRAKYRCYLEWGNFKGGETSSINYLLHSNQLNHDEIKVKQLKELCDSKSGILDIDKKSHNFFGPNRCTSFRSVPEGAYSLEKESRSRKLVRRIATRKVTHDWRILSYSYLTHSFDFSEKYDHSSVKEKHDGSTLPPGARTGLCIHEIFERSDFSADDNVLEGIVHSALERYGFSDEYFASTMSMVRTVFSQNLNDGGMKLQSVSMDMTISEMEFYFPLGKLNISRMHEVVARYYPELSGTGGANLSESQGYLKGFIDLVFCYENRYYIVDWKSNFLGMESSHYTRDAMKSEIKNHSYHLQYLIYTVALYKYLKHSVENFSYDDFGGVHYLFVRGMDGESGNYFDLPDKALIDELIEVLDGK